MAYTRSAPESASYVWDASPERSLLRQENDRSALAIWREEHIPAQTLVEASNRRKRLPSAGFPLWPTDLEKNEGGQRHQCEDENDEVRGHPRKL